MQREALHDLYVLKKAVFESGSVKDVEHKFLTFKLSLNRSNNTVKIFTPCHIIHTGSVNDVLARHFIKLMTIWS